MAKDTNPPVTKIINCRLIRDKIIYDDVLYLQNGTIIDPLVNFFECGEEPTRVIDAKGALVAPGFIDIQVNGGFGFDFSQCEVGGEQVYVENMKKIARRLLKFGCTSFMPTLISSASEVYHKILPLLCPRKGSKNDGAEILGSHVEGPFISYNKKGAHEQSTLHNAPNGFSDIAKVYGISETGNNHSIRLVTVAPEVEGVMDSIHDLTRVGITVSIGHSTATTEQAEKAVEKGARLITHLFNAMQPFHHRNPGIIGLLGTTRIPRPYYGIICDGIHVHPNSLRIAYDAHPHGAILVTDAVPAMGLPPGEHTLGQVRVRKIGNERVEVIETGKLAGAVVSIDKCIQNFKKFSGCSIVQAIEAATLHPAQLLGIQHRKGTLNVGSDADLVFLDDDLNVITCFIAGEQV
ncbi:6820_t:CDS:2 [Ambispora gerdemannii]|uniref:N-acetylglucosamine-6-phosphate deacetylase n=1 Tax=Ambispora gerdemannii TaxID=144530 RepID=A0A9N8YLX9_9GLOM|nr:6820_t:CDS:2 [Ambispora gerdemannii]